MLATQNAAIETEVWKLTAKYMYFNIYFQCNDTDGCKSNINCRAIISFRGDN